MRKQIAVFLSLILIVNMLAIPAGAANLDESSQATTTESVPEKVALKSNGDNTYTLVGPAQNISVMSRSNDLVYAEPIHTWDMELLALSNGGCLSKIGEDLYVAATQVKLDTKDFSKNYPLFEQFDIGEETIQSAKESIESQLEIGNDEFEYTIYLTEPFAVPADNATASTAAQNDSVQETIEETRNYYSPYKDIARGANAKTVVASIANCLVSVIGVGSTSFSIFGVGMTALSEYQTYAKKTITVGYPQDWSQVQFKIDWLKKSSFVTSQAHGKFLGCVSQKLWIDKVSLLQYYKEANIKHQSTYTMNKIFTTKNWENSKQVALYNWVSPMVDKSITAKVGPLTVTFSGNM